MNIRHSNTQHHYTPGQDPRDWRMTFKCYKQNVGKVYDQFTDLLAKLKKGREMLKTGNTGADKLRPMGIFAIEKLRNTGKIVLEVVDEKDNRIGQPTVICASGKRKKFVNDERTGMAVPASEQDDLLWEDSMRIAIKVVQNAIHYVEMGKLIERARKSWDDVAIMGPLGDALQTNLGFLNLEGDGEEVGILRGFLLSLVWPAVNGRSFPSLEEGFAGKSVATEEGEMTGGCWIYTWVPLVMERVAELQTKELAEMEHAAAVREAALADKIKNTVITRVERKELLAAAQGVVSLASAPGPVPQPEAELIEHKPTAEAVAAPQDAQAS